MTLEGERISVEPRTCSGPPDIPPDRNMPKDIRILEEIVGTMRTEMLTRENAKRKTSVNLRARRTSEGAGTARRQWASRLERARGLRPPGAATSGPRIVPISQEVSLDPEQSCLLVNRGSDGGICRSPAKFFQISNLAAGSGISALLNYPALLWVSLRMINLVPIPMLDGGHWLFCAIEA